MKSEKILCHRCKKPLNKAEIKYYGVTCNECEGIYQKELEEDRTINGLLVEN